MVYKDRDRETHGCHIITRHIHNQFFNNQLRNNKAPVAQWIAQWPPAPCVQVRLLPGAMYQTENNFTFETMSQT